MAQFILEIGTEEMPARFLPMLESGLRDLFSQHLRSADIAFSDPEVFSTPRRLVTWIADIAQVQERRRELITGPPASIGLDEQGQLSKAGTGFAKSQGVETSELFVHETAKGRYLAVEKTTGGREVSSILPGMCAAIAGELSFPKKMRWERSGFTFGRPVRWILALLDEEAVPVQIASVTGDRYTWGHRVLGLGPWRVESAGEYFDIIRNKGRVVLDPAERKRIVREEGERLARAESGRVIWEEPLFEEVSNLVEMPRPVLGRFDEAYLELPREVLLTSMESHQKSFGVEDERGGLLPFFLCTLNLEPKDLDLVRNGWERVLKARLEDAAFFWKSDLKASFEQWLQELDKVVFLGPLGSMGDKVARLERLGAEMAGLLAPERSADIERAARLCKTDLVSEMVGEFDDLQGIMGGIYARRKGEKEIVARAVYEHYRPTGQESPVPETIAGAILSMVDKADNLAGCFGLNMIPTGAHDPYALRRQTLGIIRVTLEHGLRYSLSRLLRSARESYAEGVEWKLSPEETLQALTEFFAHRIKGAMAARGFGNLVIDAVLGAGFDDLWSTYGRLQALQAFSREQDFEQAVLTFKRADNIIRKQGDQAGRPLDGFFDPSQLQETQEKELASRLQAMQPRWEEMWNREAFPELFGMLRELRPAVDGFFDHVMVMCEDPSLRVNRLNLLKSLVDRLSSLADFSALQI
jgi:glycyl-tRNA synthetase beta chain